MKSPNLKELTIWQTQLKNVKSFASTNVDIVKNPTCVGSTLFYSIFSDGQLVAVNKKTGQELWRFEYGYLGGNEVIYSKGTIYASNSRRIFCIDLKTRKSRWSFCPYGDDGEHMYSAPVLDKSRLYVGDRCGFLHCLETKTGKTIWKVQTGSGKKNQVNATALVHKNLIYALNIGKTVSAYDKNNGNLVWYTKLSDSSIYKPYIYKSYLLVSTGKHIYFLSLTTGRIQSKKTIKLESLRAILNLKNSLLVIDCKKNPKDKVYKTTDYLFNFKNRKRNLLAKGHFFNYGLTYFKEKKLIMLSTFYSLMFYSLKHKRMVCEIPLKDPIFFPTTPYIEKGKMYFATERGHIHCIRIPEGL